MRNAVVQLLRGVGAAALGVTALPLLLILGYSAIMGLRPVSRNPSDVAPELVEVLSISARQWGVLGRTALIGLLATAFSFLLAIPATYAVGLSRSIHLRRAMLALVAWPLLAPPCIMGYSWTLLATQSTWPGRALAAIGWNSATLAPLWAAWMQANWLWPIPALILSIAYRRQGRPALRLALLDVPPHTAFMQAALPAMAGSVAAAAALVAMLSLGDMTIAPLILAHVWTGEMNTEVARAAQLDPGAGYLLWRSWPMILLVAALVAVLMRPLARLFGDAPAAETDDSGSGNTASRYSVALAAIFVTVLVLFPTAVFISELRQSPDSLSKAFSWAGYLFFDDAKASLLVAGICGLAAIGIGLASIRERFERRWRHRVTAWALGAMILLALLPAPTVGRGLIDLLDRPMGIPRDWHWHPYDDTPFAWILGMIARFGFVPMVIALSARRGCVEDAADQARLDGASGLTILARIRVPELAGPLLAGGILVFCLALSELQVSSMLIPPRFGGSVAVSVDQQVHFGRQTNVIAMCLLLSIPALIGAALAPILLPSDSGGTSRRTRIASDSSNPGGAR